MHTQENCSKEIKRQTTLCSNMYIIRIGIVQRVHPSTDSTRTGNKEWCYDITLSSTYTPRETAQATLTRVRTNF